MAESYSIGEIAGLTGVSVETLRYYERQRLLKPPPRTDGGFRRYGSDVVAHVTFIKQAQSLGLSLGGMNSQFAITNSQLSPEARSLKPEDRANLQPRPFV